MHHTLVYVSSINRNHIPLSFSTFVLLCKSCSHVLPKALFGFVQFYFAFCSISLIVQQCFATKSAQTERMIVILWICFVILFCYSLSECLRNLWFSAWHYLNPPPSSTSSSPIDLPILAQLERFHFYIHDTAIGLHDSLKQYAEPNTNLKQLQLSNSVYHTWDAEKFLNFSPSFASRFIGLSFTVIDLTQVHFVCL